MTYMNCRICGFRGHGHEVRSHYRQFHVGVVNVQIHVNEEKDEMTLTIQGHVIKTALPQTLGKLDAIEISGRWKQPTFWVNKNE